MRCRGWFLAGVVLTPALALAAHAVTVLVARVWWAHH
jgi:hypothetical protein